MVTAIRQRVTIEAGGVVRVQSPDLPEGAQAEVIVLVEPALSASDETPKRPLSSFIGSAKGVFKSVEEADAFIRAERDAWED